MQVTIGGVNAFTEKCVRGITANPERAEAWLEKNAIVVTVLNPIIGYSAGAELVKEALQSDSTIRQLALQKAKEGELIHRRENRPVKAAEIEAALGDLFKLTEGGIY
jgi:fumarate hydratase class II